MAPGTVRLVKRLEFVSCIECRQVLEPADDRTAGPARWVESGAIERDGHPPLFDHTSAF
ncbi:MAG: hypothetical protein KGJ13_09105 [Patescibacteria group bacterium]|nr:hypothetical protein [Patescibacteria group bacterium]